MKNIKFAVLLVCIVTYSLSVQAVATNSQRFTGDETVFEKVNSLVQPVEAKKDIDVWFDWIHATHPDLSYTVNDIEKFYTEVAQIKDGINSPINLWC